MAVKISWRSMFPSCCRQEAAEPEEIEQVKNEAKPRSLHRVSLSSLSNISSLSEDLSASLLGSKLHVFTLQELKVVTHDFSSSNFLGEGGFGPVHKGFVDDRLRPGLEAMPVAVKLLNLNGLQGHREWLTEVIFLGRLRHPHLVKLIGYCCEDERRLLVYEYMPRGSLEDQLFTRYSATLPWSARMKIALGAAKGLAFLHEAEKPVICRDFKGSNILLDSDYTVKLSDFGLAKDGPVGDDTHVSTRVMGTQGYAAPEYLMTGHLTARSDVYSFGVVLLELLTGRKSVDKSRPSREQNLVEWARPVLNNPRKMGRIMDPRLEGQYSEIGAQRAAALVYQCLSHRPKERPTMCSVVNVLEPLKDFDDVPIAFFVYTVRSTKVCDDEGKESEKEKGTAEDGMKKMESNHRHHSHHRSRRGHHLRHHGHHRSRRGHHLRHHGRHDHEHVNAPKSQSKAREMGGFM